MKQSMRTLTSSASNDWCTPPDWIALVREVLGDIDLDPASNAIANQHLVKAKHYYADSGLSLQWKARTIFLNPPYQKIGNESGAGIWLEKLLHEYQSGHCDEGIALTKTVPGYGWFDKLFHGGWPGPCCITKGLISFVHVAWVNSDGTLTIPKGKSNKSKSASTFWYVGHNDKLFGEVFSRVGMVIV